MALNSYHWLKRHITTFGRIYFQSNIAVTERSEAPGRMPWGWLISKAFLMHVTLTPLPSYPNEFVGSPLGTNRIGWHLILLRARRQPLDWIATVGVSCKKNTAGTQRIRVALTLVKQVFGVKVGILFLGDCNALFRVRLQNVSDT